jgi:hypothetical protein
VKQDRVATELRGHVFVVGCGQRGTSLVAAMLGVHSRAHAIPFETEAFVWDRRPKKAAHSQGVNQGWHHGACEMRWIVEKTPGHLFAIGKIREAFKETTFVALLRDPRDVACSFMRRTGSSGRDRAMADVE